MGAWNRSKAVWENEDRIMMLELSQAEKWCIATLLTGFRYALLKPFLHTWENQGQVMVLAG
jgi:hypothetical protein